MLPQGSASLNPGAMKKVGFETVKTGVDRRGRLILKTPVAPGDPLMDWRQTVCRDGERKGKRLRIAGASVSIGSGLWLDRAPITVRGTISLAD
ncbi:MAG: hypothetical protein JXB25_11725 [Deltaproteobacteria bacterium]|nr:hypothetical protein [Deltaproteobacteria bacterium]